MEVKEIYKSMTYGPAPESNKESIAFLDSYNRQFGNYVNGNWQKPANNTWFDAENPATKEHLSKIAQSSTTDVDQAVKAAKDAQKLWSSIGGHERAKYMYAIARQIQKHSRVIAVLESMDNGKPIRETRDIDIPLVARHFYHHAGWAQLMSSQMVGYKSVGVVGQIIPWNFPLLMLSWKIAPALAMGNTVVLKPAESTSLSALFFAQICHEIGLPKGVVNIVTGFGDAGAAIVNHPDVDKIAFTGSTEVGKIIRRSTAGTGKKISLELGGKSPFIVFEDADLDSVVEGIVDAIWFNQGQVCCAGSRLLVQESIEQKLYEKIRNRMEKLRVGNSLDKTVDIGAIVSHIQLKTIEDLVEVGRKEGNEVWQPSWECPKGGYYYPPTLLTNITQSSTLAQVEIFGPVLVAMSFRSHEEAVKLANNTRYGLASSLWTEDINLALDIAPKIKAGTVWINCSNLFDAASGFGGYRESGFGREGGKEGLYEYVKYDDQSVVNSKSFYKIGKSNSKPNTTSKSVFQIDRTAKMYIGGKQARPDGGNSLSIKDIDGQPAGEVGKGNRKDIRNAVEAAHAASGWTGMTGYAKAQILYYLAENLSIRQKEFSERIQSLTGRSQKEADEEIQLSIQRLFSYAAWADKYDGKVHSTLTKHVTLAMNEAIGVIAIVCPDDFPLLGLISTIAPAIAMGNRTIVVPSAKYPLLATDFYQILDTSDVPGGVINIVTGEIEELAIELAKHDDVDAMWYFAEKDLSKKIEVISAENLKRTWVNHSKFRDWTDSSEEVFLSNAVEVKNIWIPYGV
jgi:aldehyde dehydrogenase (NAD+)